MNARLKLIVDTLLISFICVTKVSAQTPIVKIDKKMVKIETNSYRPDTISIKYIDNSKKQYGEKKRIYLDPQSGLGYVFQNGKWGLVNNKGKQIAEPVYDGMDFYSFNYVWHNTPSGYYFPNFQNGLLMVKRSGKFGYIDEKGKIVVPIQFEAAVAFYDKDLTPVKQDGKWGYIDRSGKVAIPCIYEDAASFSENGLAAVVQNKELGFINKNGILVIPFRYNRAKKFYNGSAIVENHKHKEGILHESGTELVECKYNWIKLKEKGGIPYYHAVIGEHAVPYFFDTSGRRYKNLDELLAANKNAPSPNPTNKLAIMDWLNFASITQQKNYSFRVGVKSDSKVEEVAMYVNGQQERGINSVKNDGYSMTIDKTVVLNEGENIIKVTVKNGGGTAVSEKVVTYKGQGQAIVEWLGFKPTTTERKFNLKVGVKSASRIDNYLVTVNRVEERGINAVNTDGYSMTINKTLTLEEGDNIIRIEVKNGSGIAVSEKTVKCKLSSPQPMVKEKRIALVIGNANYKDSDKRLKNPVNDATDVAKKLEGLGFTVIRSLDQTHQGMEAAITNFGNQAYNYDVALFYYAGHGVSCEGDNFLVPIDASLPEESYVKYNCTNANLVLDLMDKAKCKMKIVILDACRNNPFARSWSRGGVSAGLNIMNAPKGTFIAFSTAPGDVAQDGKVGDRNSPYTAALLQTFDVPNLSITDFFQEVLEKVAVKTNERQTPWTSNSFRGKFVFNKQ